MANVVDSLTLLCAADGKAYMTATGGTAMDLYFDADILLDAFASVPVAMAAPTPTQRAGSLAPLRNNPHFQSVDDPSARSPPLLQPPPPTDKSLSAYAETIAKLEDDTSKASSLAVKHSVDGDGHLSSGAIVDFLQVWHMYFAIWATFEMLFTLTGTGHA